MTRSGEWRLSSKRDPRWNTAGSGTLLAGHMCAAAEEAIEKLREAYGEPPLDLHYDERASG